MWKVLTMQKYDSVSKSDSLCKSLTQYAKVNYISVISQFVVYYFTVIIADTDGLVWHIKFGGMSFEWLHSQPTL